MKRRGDRVRRELADLVLRLCVVGGVILGLFAGLEADQPKPKPCEPGTGCVGEGFATAMTPLLVPVVVGALLGTLVGFALAMAIKPRR